jgi:hypothetical protein
VDRLWKLPPIELSPTDDGGWAVQSEAGLGRAQAVFLPLRDGELALDARTQLRLTAVDDASWTPVPVQAARCPQAPDWLCLLRYEHPAERPGDTFFVPDHLPMAAGAEPSEEVHEPGVGRDELLRAFARVKAQLGDRLALHVVPSPLPPTPNASPPAARAMVASVDAAGVDAAPEALCIAFASCQYPAGMLDRPVAHRAFERLAAYLQEAEGPVPQRLLLLGDQVYTDATYGFIDPARIDDRYRLPYEDFTDREDGPFASLPQTFLALRRMVLDDHEIRDNWEPGPQRDGQGNLLPDPERDAGLAGYWKYQRRSAPPAGGAVHFTEHGAHWRLFMADSRSARDPRTEAGVDTATILGEAQTRQLREWLQQPADGALRIVSCAAMLLPRTRLNIDDPLYHDGWQGYPASLQGLLALLCEEEARDLVFLSGDAHLACDARVTVTCGSKQARFASFHAPALYAPYPFANEQPANLLLDDIFEFRVDERSYRCEIQARVLAGGRRGCGLLRAQRGDGEWRVAYDVLEPAGLA